MKKLLLCAVLCLLMTGAAFAQKQKESYIGVEAGLFIPSESKLDSGFDIGVKFIHYFTENIGVNGILSYRSFGADYEEGPYKWEVDWTTISLAGGVSGRYSLNKSFDLVGDAGIAYHMNTGEMTGTLYGVSISDDDKQNKLGFYLDAGANFRVTPDVAVGGLIRYTTNEAYTDYELGGISILLTVGYLF